MQLDADSFGSASPAADAEMCMMMADTLEALGISRGDYLIRVNNRKVLDGVMEAIGLAGAENAGKRLTVLRAIDKLDKFGPEGVKLLLGKGRWDGGTEGEGDFTKGAGLDEAAINTVIAFTEAGAADSDTTAQNLKAIVSGNVRGTEGVDELAQIKYADRRGSPIVKIGRASWRERVL